MSTSRPSLRTLTSVLSLALSLSAGPAAAGVETLLSCDFDAEPLDQLVATGGAVVGQPTSLGGVPAYVRATPMATPSLELTDDWGPNARAVAFDFLNDAEITSGVVEVSMNLSFASLGNYDIGVRRHGDFATSFLTLHFQEAGVIRYSDNDTVPFDIVGNYVAASVYALHVVFDLDQHTYDVRLNGTPLIGNGSWSPTTDGIGRVYAGLAHDADASGTYSVDDILVTATEVPTAVEVTSWTSVKSLYR